MNAQTIQEVKKDLLIRRANLLERLEKLDKNKTRADGPLQADFEEQAVELQSAEVVDALDEMELAELRKIDGALNLIESGTYGNCSLCGDAISGSRLKALPYTNTCISCAEEA